MGLPTIRALAQFAGATARRSGFQPYHPECVEDINPDNPEFRIPFLGSNVAPGWRRIEDVWLVDKTGRAKEDGLALRFRQFVQMLRDHYVTHPGAG